MNLSDRKLGNAIVIDVAGRLDSATTPAFDAYCDKLMAEGAITFVMNFEKLDFINSGALRSIILMMKKVKPQGGNIVICGAKGTAKETFEVFGFSNMFPIAETMEDAASLLECGG